MTLGVDLSEVKKRTPGSGAAAVDLSVTAYDPLDRIRVRDVGGSVGGGQLRGACPGSPPFSLYRRVTGAHQPLNGCGSPIRSGSAWPLGHAGRDQTNTDDVAAAVVQRRGTQTSATRTRPRPPFHCSSGSSTWRSLGPRTPRPAGSGPTTSS